MPLNHPWMKIDTKAECWNIGSGVVRGGGGGGGGVAVGGIFLGGTFGWGGTLGFKYLMYYSTTDLDPQSTFTSYQCSKVLSEKWHFRDPDSKTFQGGMAMDLPDWPTLQWVRIQYTPLGGERHFKNSPLAELLLATPQNIW